MRSSLELTRSDSNIITPIDRNHTAEVGGGIGLSMTLSTNGSNKIIMLGEIANTTSPGGEGCGGGASNLSFYERVVKYFRMLEV